MFQHIVGGDGIVVVDVVNVVDSALGHGNVQLLPYVYGALSVA
jgi:hypothetical protein